MATGRLPDPNTAPVTAKGDLYTYSTVPAKLAVGNNGETLVADSSTTTGLRWQGDYAAGKNKILNGDFNINQRNFSTSTNPDSAYNFDRWNGYAGTVGGASAVFSKQTFTPGSAPVAGYEAINYLRIVTTSQDATSSIVFPQQRIEDVRTFAGQTVTISFWAKANSGTPKLHLETAQNFGSGGSPSSETITNFGQVTLSTSWARYSATASLPSLSGKTIGTTAGTSYLAFQPWVSAGTTYNARTNSLGAQNNTFEFWGFQLEAGSVATAFQTATGTLAGELAACQRYYTTSIPTGYTITDFPIMGTTGAGGVIFTCSSGSTNDLFGTIQYPVTLRSTPTINIYSGNNRTSGSVRDMVTGTDATVSSYSAQTGQNKNFTYMGVGTFTNSRQYGFHYTASAEL